MFKMIWLNDLIGYLLTQLGINIHSKLGMSIQFFFYDTIKIMILLGVLILIISYIQSYFPPEKIKQILKKFHGFKANVLAALLGTLTPFCSCSSIPIFIGFTNARLPLGVTFSFLISSPMVDLASILLLTSIFGWKIAGLYVLFGLLIAIIGGMMIEKIAGEDQLLMNISISNDVDYKQTLTQQQRIKNAWNEVIHTYQKVYLYIMIGVAIGAMIHNYIPETWIIYFLGNNNIFAPILACFAGIPLYADLFGTIPIAQALLSKHAMLGVVLTFMMAVTTLSLPLLIMLSKVIKPRLMIIFISICTIGMIIVGYVFNMIQPFIM